MYTDERRCIEFCSYLNHIENEMKRDRREEKKNRIGFFVFRARIARTELLAMTLRKSDFASFWLSKWTFSVGEKTAIHRHQADKVRTLPKRVLSYCRLSVSLSLSVIYNTVSKH